MADDWRAKFDAEVLFRNGGGLQVQDFRLDVGHDGMDDQDLAEALVRHLGLLMVESVRITRRTFLKEAHKGSRGTATSPGPRRLVELSHDIRHGMVTYPGLPGPEISVHLSREASREHYCQGCEFHIGRISLVANTGTYLDTPFHRYADGPDLARVELASLADLEGVVVHLAGDGPRAIGSLAFAPFEVAGKAVLVHTGWDRHWGTDQYGSGHPFLTREAAEWLVAHRAALVGIDALNIDDTGDGARPVHSILLAAGIPVVEHLTGLEQLPAQGFRFHAAPPRIQGMGTFPVRAFAVVPGAQP